jgi:hypothetical protein
MQSLWDFSSTRNNALTVPVVSLHQQLNQRSQVLPVGFRNPLVL